MRILIFGGNGQIGKELIRSSRSHYTLFAPSRKYCDISITENITRHINEFSPDVIINAAAFTNVDEAETNQEYVKNVNADALSKIAIEAKRTNSLVIHYSTDFIFGGDKNTPYIETDEPNPLNFYGRSKMLGELNLIKNFDNYIILRTAWVFSKYNTNFLIKILNLAKANKKMQLIDNFIGSPISANEICRLTYIIIDLFSFTKDSVKRGTYHIGGSKNLSWYKFARLIIMEAIKLNMLDKYSQNLINKINNKEFFQLAKRPKNSSLDSNLFYNTFDIRSTSLKSDIKQVLVDIKNAN